MGIETPATFDAFFLKLQAYIQHEEKEEAHAIRNSRHEENSKSRRQEEGSRRRADKKKEDKNRDPRDYKGQTGKFREYNPLNASREHILTECANVEFHTGKVCFPKSMPAKPNVDKSKYCRFYKGHRQNTGLYPP